MALVENKFPEPGQPFPVEDRLRRRFFQGVNDLQTALRLCSQMVDDVGGKSEMETLLGDDGADLESGYNAMKALVEAWHPDPGVPPLEPEE